MSVVLVRSYVSSTQRLSWIEIVATLFAVAFVLAVAIAQVEECQTVPGSFSSGFSAGFDVSRKVCGRVPLARAMLDKMIAVARHAIN